MEESLKKVPSFIFTGDNNEKLREGFLHFINNSPISNIEEDEGLFSELTLLRSSLISQFKHIGLDVSERITPLSRIHLLNTDSFEDIRKKLKYEQDTRAFYSSTYFNIYVRMQDKDANRTKASLFRSCCHELIHSLSFFEIELNIKKQTFLVKSGSFHTVQNKPDFFLEGFVDLCTIQQIKNFWPEDDVLKEYEYEAFNEISYPGNIMILDAILNLVAKKADYTYAEFLVCMQRDFVLGTKKSLEYLLDLLGNSGFSTLMEIPYIKQNDNALLLETAKKIGLEDFISEWKASDNGKSFIYCKSL